MHTNYSVKPSSDIDETGGSSVRVFMISIFDHAVNRIAA